MNWSGLASTLFADSMRGKAEKCVGLKGRTVSHLPAAQLGAMNYVTSISTDSRFYVLVDWICKHWPTYEE